MNEGPARHRVFDQARRRAELTVHQLWLRYLSIGGHGDLLDVEAFLLGLATLPRFEQDVLAHAVNEELAELYEAARVPYLDLPGGEAGAPGEDPLAVLDELLSPSESPEQDGPQT